MDSRSIQRIVSLTMSMIITVSTITPCYADEGNFNITSTIPVQEPVRSASSTLLATLSENDPYHNLIDYLGFKNITVADMQAIKWSFVLSQMAMPLEESLVDVLNSDIVLQMRDMNLKISEYPDALDRDYTYSNDGKESKEYEVNHIEFKKVYDIIMNVI